MRLLNTSLLGIVIAVGISDLAQAAQAAAAPAVVCYPNGNRSKHTCNQTVRHELEQCLADAESAKKDAMSNGNGAERAMELEHVLLKERGCHTTAHQHSALCAKCPDQ